MRLHFYLSIFLMAISSLLSGCGDNISNIKNGVLNNYSKSLTVEKAFNSWSVTQECLKINWEELASDRGENIVKFVCEIDPKKIQEAESNQINAYLQEVNNYFKTNDIKINEISNSNLPEEEKKSEIRLLQEDKERFKDSIDKSKQDLQNLVQLIKVQIIVEFPTKNIEKSLNVNYVGIKYVYNDSKYYMLPNQYILNDIYRNSQTALIYENNFYKSRK